MTFFLTNLLCFISEVANSGLVFSSGGRLYRKVVSYRNHDYAYWSQRCTGLLSFSLQPKVYRFVIFLTAAKVEWFGIYLSRIKGAPVGLLSSSLESKMYMFVIFLTRVKDVQICHIPHYSSRCTGLLSSSLQSKWTGLVSTSVATSKVHL